MRDIRLQKPINRTKHKLLSPFSARHRNKLLISTQPLALQLVAAHLIASDDQKLLFVKNSKAGCTTIAHLIYEYSRGGNYDGNIHRRGAGLITGLSEFERIRTMLSSSATYKFTFVRDPLARAVSCFKNLFVQKQNSFGTKHFPAIRARGFVDEQGASESNFAAFLTLAEDSMKIDAELTDPHFRSQVKNTGFGSVNYNRICRLENYEAEIKRVFEEAGADFTKLENSVRRKENATRQAKLVIGDELRSRVRAIYAEDYEAFDFA